MRNTSETEERRTFSVQEVGRMLGLGKNGAYDAVRRGEIPSIKVGRRLLVPRVAVERMLGETDRRPGA